MGAVAGVMAPHLSTFSFSVSFTVAHCYSCVPHSIFRPKQKPKQNTTPIAIAIIFLSQKPPTPTCCTTPGLPLSGCCLFSFPPPPCRSLPSPICSYCSSSPPTRFISSWRSLFFPSSLAFTLLHFNIVFFFTPFYTVFRSFSSIISISMLEFHYLSYQPLIFASFVYAIKTSWVLNFPGSPRTGGCIVNLRFSYFLQDVGSRLH